MSETGILTEQGMAARAFSIWTDYWLSLGPKTPPLHLANYTADGGVLFIAPMGRPEVHTAIETIAKKSELSFLMEGESLIKEHTWFGHWCAFSVNAIPMARVQLHPTPVQMRPGRWIF